MNRQPRRFGRQRFAATSGPKRHAAERCPARRRRAALPFSAARRSMMSGRAPGEAVPGGERRPEASRLDLRVGFGIRQRQRVDPIRDRAAAHRAARGRRRHRLFGRTRRTGAESCRPIGSKSIALLGRWRRNRKRVRVGRQDLRDLVRRGARALGRAHLLAADVEELVGMLSGGSRSKTRREIASARSREPPAVARSLPQPSIVAPTRPQRAAQSTFQTILARPPKGETRPLKPQPVAHSTRSARHS